MAFKVPEQYRVTTGALATDSGYGCNGMFVIKHHQLSCAMNVVVSDGDGVPFAAYKWEHVSVSNPRRTPTWEDMCFIKSLFWDAEDVVIQLHPPQSEWVNNHHHCLHLWRKAGTNDYCERPPALYV